MYFLIIYQIGYKFQKSLPSQHYRGHHVPGPHNPDAAQKRNTRPSATNVRHHFEQRPNHECFGYRDVRRCTGNDDWKDAGTRKATAGILHCNERGHDDHYAMGYLVSDRICVLTFVGNNDCLEILKNNMI